MSYGVGIIGAGPGVAALHVPTLARLDGDFAIVHISDAGSGRARALADRIGARWSSGIDDLLADPDVEVVAICSPPARARRAGPRERRRGQAGHPLREAGRDDDGGCDRGDRGVPRGRHPAARRHQPLFDAGVGQGQAPPHRDRRPGARDLGDAGAAAERPVPRRRDRARGAGRRRGRGGPDLRRPAGRGIRRPSAAHRDSRSTTCRCCATSRPASSASCSRGRSRRSATRSGYVASRHPGPARRPSCCPDGADALWRLDDHDRRRAAGGVVPSGVRPRGQRACAGAVRRRARHRRTRAYAEDGYVAEWRALAELLDERDVDVEYDELLDDARYALRLADAAAAT